MATDSKPTDSTSKTPSPEAAKPEEHHNLLDLMEGVKKNVLAPIYNSAAVDVVNTGANVVNGALDLGTGLINSAAKTDYHYQVGKLHEVEVGKAAPGSVASYSQQIFGTAGSFLAYAVASKVAGRALRSAGELAPLELEIADIKVGSSLRAVAQDTRVATVVGATAYAGLRDTKDGESHLSNAVSTFVGFSAFEAGNSLLIKPGASGLSKLGQRYFVGALGGMAQTNAASLVQDGKFANENALQASALSGGLLNAIMPSGQHLVDRAVESPLIGGLPRTTEATARLHAEAARALPKGEAPEPGTWADPKTIKALDFAARADLGTKFKINDTEPTRIDQEKNVVYQKTGADPLDVLQELAHRRIYKDPKFEQAFQSHAKEIQSADPADPKNAGAKENYVKTRVEQEIAARTAQNEEAVKLGLSRRISVDPSEIRIKEGYGKDFEREADDFIKTGGKSRPIIDNSAGGGHSGGHAGDGGHVVNTVSHAHAENVGHGHTDGIGGGTGARPRPSDSSTVREPLTIDELGDDERSADPKDWPAVKNVARHSGVGYEDPSDEYPAGRKLEWYSYPGGAHVNGHDNVVWAAHYDPNMDEVMLVKRDPYTLERSAVKLRNDEMRELHVDGRDGTIQTTSVEKMFDVSANDVPLNKLYDSSDGLRAIRYEVAEGNDLIPDHTTYTRFAFPQRYEINGEDISPTASVEYHDGSGRIDWHQDYPFENLISEWPEPIEDNNIRYRVTVPQSIPGSHRIFRLDANDQPAGVTDIFAADHPLDTDFGEAVRVDREGDSDLYHMKDGSAVLIGHHDGKMYQTHRFNGIDETKVYKGDEGYSERYSTPWETIFGQAKEVKITPTKAIYHLVNEGTVEHYKDPTSYLGFKSVDWIYHDPSGDTAVQLHDGSQTRVLIPHDGVDTGIAGVNNAVGMTDFEGVGGFKRYYLANGSAMDVMPSSPTLGVIRNPGQLTLIGEVNGSWKEASFFFKTGELPEVVEADAVNGSKRSIQPYDKCLDDENNVIDLYPEVYPNGLMTKWGLATERHTFWTGSSTMKIADGSKDGVWIELDLDGNRVHRNAKGEITSREPEPDRYPHLKNLPAPRRIVNASDFPQNNPDGTGSAVVEDESAYDDDTPVETHEENTDDLLDDPGD